MANKITLGSAFDAETIIQGGILNYAYLVNWEDFDNAQVLTIDGTSKKITAITLAIGTKGYKFESSKGSAQIMPSAAYRGVTAIDGYDHSLDLRVLDNSQVSRNNITKLRFQKVVAIIPLADGDFMLYGRNVGLRITDLQELPGDADTGGTLNVVLKTPDNDPPEINLPIRIDSTYVITGLDTNAV